MSNLLLFLVFITPILNQQTSYKFSLDIAESQCLFEYFPEKTTVIFSVSSSGKEYQIDLKDSKGNVIMSKKNTNFNEGYTTDNSGYFEICTFNLDSETTEFNFNMKYGVAANDYSSIVKAKDLRPIDVEMLKILDRKNLIEQYNIFSQRHDQLFEVSLNNMSRRIIFYSAILMIFMIIIGLSETLYLKKFMEKRKII